ncbi:MAG: hypothetical protein HZB38_17165 [Planctomycetes bacterium]|nr:hypothetical protein [Planctomycetota bacterium]
MSARPVDPLTAELGRLILDPLARLRRRARVYIALGGALRLAFVVVLSAAAQLVLDRWFKLTLDQRALFNVALTFFWLSVLYRRVLLPLSEAISDSELAASVDRVHPDLHDQISTAVQFSAGEIGHATSNSPQLVRAVLSDACTAARGVAFDRVLDHNRAKDRLARLLAIVAASFLPLLLPPTRDLMSTWFRRNWLMQDVPWPQYTYMRAVGYDRDGARSVPLGDPLEIAAEITGETPDAVLIEWWNAAGGHGSETMMLYGDRRAQITLGPITEPVHFRLTGNDERTREYVASPVERPAVVHTLAEVQPPAYTGLPPARLADQTVLELLSGSHLKITADLNKPVRTARLVNAGGQAAPLELAETDRLVVDWPDPAAGEYAFELEDEAGWKNRRTVRYTIKVTPDLPPMVKLAARDVGDAVTPQADLVLDFAFEDAYGLTRASWMSQRDEDPPVGNDLGPTGESKSRERHGETRFEVGNLPALAGQRIRLWAEAADNDPAGPNVGKSQPIELRVLSPGDFLAEMAGRELELRQEFERLISEQNGLRDGIERLVASMPAEGPTPLQTAQRLGGLARRQEAHAARVLAIQRGIERIVAEMRTSRVLRPAEERRLNDRIVAPLAEIGGDTMPAAAALLSDLKREADVTKAARVPGVQAEVIRRMKAVLANMLENEGYREAVALLEEIIARQGGIHDDTVQQLSREIEAIIGLDESAPTTRPKR